LSAEIAHRLSALAHAGNYLLEVPPTFFGRQLREEAPLHIVFGAKIVPGDADLGFARVIQR
jgi:hypothetical protein